MATERCERVLGTVLRCVGAPWNNRICLIGGLVPRYLLPQDSGHLASLHVGSTDVDVALSLAVGDADDGAYATLKTNLKRAGLERLEGSSWQWGVEVDGHQVVLELIGEDEDVEGGTLFQPQVEPPAGTGGISLLCVRGVSLLDRDHQIIEREIMLLDDSLATVGFRVAGLATFLALKADAYLDRRKFKDVYDFIYVVRNWPGGPRSAAQGLLSSEIAREPFVIDSLERLDRDFESRNHAGPRDYSAFLSYAGTVDGREALKDEALLVWRQFREEHLGA